MNYFIDRINTYDQLEDIVYPNALHFFDGFIRKYDVQKYEFKHKIENDFKHYFRKRKRRRVKK